jgi:hypothetical protein
MIGYGWFIVLGVVMLIGIAAHILTDKDQWHEGTWIAISATCLVLTITLLFSLPIVAISTKSNAAQFVHQKEYIASHIPADPIENAAITNKKIELNSWLFGVQFMKSKFGNAWTFTPSDILDWKPIQ